MIEQWFIQILGPNVAMWFGFMLMIVVLGYFVIKMSGKPDGGRQ